MKKIIFVFLFSCIILLSSCVNPALNENMQVDRTGVIDCFMPGSR